MGQSKAQRGVQSYQSLWVELTGFCGEGASRDRMSFCNSQKV